MNIFKITIMRYGIGLFLFLGSLLTSLQEAKSQCATVINAGGLVEICIGDPVDIVAELNTPPTGYTFTWTGSVSGVLKVATGFSGSFLSYTPTTTEYVTVTIQTKTGCPNVTDRVKVDVHNGATFVNCVTIDNFNEPATPAEIIVKSPALGGPTFATQTVFGNNNGGIIGNKRTMNIWYILGSLTARADVLQETDPFSPYLGEWFYSSSNDEGNELN